MDPPIHTHTHTRREVEVQHPLLFTSASSHPAHTHCLREVAQEKHFNFSPPQLFCICSALFCRRCALRSSGLKLCHASGCFTSTVRRSWTESAAAPTPVSPFILQFTFYKFVFNIIDCTFTRVLKTIQQTWVKCFRLKIEFLNVKVNVFL